MEGGSGSDAGIIPRTVDHNFTEMTRLAEQGWEYKMEVSILEIYNEDLRDLLASPADAKNLSYEIKLTDGGSAHTPRDQPQDNDNLSRGGAAENQEDRRRQANKIISGLSRVSMAIGRNKRHMPSRAAKFTQLLEAALGGKSTTLMMAGRVRLRDDQHPSICAYGDEQVPHQQQGSWQRRLNTQ
ncbi:kinesin-like protein KIFC1 [Hyalella azteca]|uniref:Kinesin-like protein KIFC1 n=1 Tax=Hyalella azteca TaxID=294128 RepID=A0A8B7NNS2_HYAAZ|nr:kinesin-like protein KIFC1 [Hyalella azteca]